MRYRSTEVNVPSPLPISKLHIIKDKLSVTIEGDVCISSDMHPATVSATSEDREAVQDSPGTVVQPASEVVTHSQQSTKEENDPIPGGAGLASQPHWDHSHPNPESANLHLVFLERDVSRL